MRLDKGLYVCFQLTFALIQLQLPAFLMNWPVMSAKSAIGDAGGDGDGDPNGDSEPDQSIVSFIRNSLISFHNLTESNEYMW